MKIFISEEIIPVQKPEMNEADEPPVLVEGENIETSVLRMFRKKEEHIIPSQNSLNFMQAHFPTATDKDWNNWQWQIKNSITTFEQLQQILQLSENEIKPLSGKNVMLPIRITPYYASLMSRSSAEHPIRRTMVPVFDEMLVSQDEAADPLHEGHDSPVPNLVHRYPDRVLFLATGFCSAYCRYCTRSHMVAKDKCHIGIKAWQPAIDYIKNHTEIRDVLISGGDPLTMAATHIEYLLKSLREIPHVEMIRIGTKVPVVLPQRITRSFVNMLKKYHPLYMSVHFTHPDEITPEVAQACKRLVDAGIPLGSQTVLLKGINDNVETMTKLMHELLKIRVRPYYLYQCDPIPGSAHFRTSVNTGLQIIKGLRGHTSGYAVPHFVIDAPGGGGKIPLLPEYKIGYDSEGIILRNYENKLFHYPDFL